jgi:hypothetical protein
LHAAISTRAAFSEQTEQVWHWQNCEHPAQRDFLSPGAGTHD